MSFAATSSAAQSSSNTSAAGGHTAIARAAFSITRDTPWAYETLSELGFRYDSSQYDSPRIPRRIGPVPPTPYRLELPSGREIWEFPITVWRIRGRPVPVGGGAYWRVLPAAVLRRALRQVTGENAYPVLYFHPYELDPRPLRAALPESPTPRQRLLAGWKSVQRNPAGGASRIGFVQLPGSSRSPATRRHMEKSSNATELVRDHFREKASSFDALYDEEHLLQRAVRPGLLKRRDFAIDVVREHSSPRVLDIGGGSGRVGELALEAGASEYVNADIAQEMLDLSKERLARFGDKVKLVHGDALTAPLEGKFDVVLALGFFDYQSDAHVFVRRIADLTSGSAVASFPRWNWLKGPVRKLRYEVVNNCPIFNYTERELRFLFGGAGFGRVLIKQGRSGFLVRADR